MATFLTHLWESIFTPGPTPTLLVATNATFAALQVLLLALFVVTYSVHFVILSFLCGGLWWGINWFACEIAAAQEKEEEAKRIRRVRSGFEKSNTGGDSPAVGEGAGESGALGSVKEVPGGVEGGEGEGMDSGDDTETEIEQSGHLPSREGEWGRSSEQSSGKSQELRRAAAATASGSALKPRDDAAWKRRSFGGDSSNAEMSTDSEWEKISEQGN
jgi:hypothetical protein